MFGMVPLCVGLKSHSKVEYGCDGHAMRNVMSNG